MRMTATALLLALLTATASAQQSVPIRPTVSPARVLTNLPVSSTVTNYYKQNIYDLGDNKIGEIMDVLFDGDGKIAAFIVGVGGFLGVGEKDVAVPFNSVHATTKNNNKWYLVMNSTKDALKSAPGYKYDRAATMWVPTSAPTASTGMAPTAPAPITR